MRPQDRPTWSDQDGGKRITKSDAEKGLPDSWRWLTDWSVVIHEEYQKASSIQCKCSVLIRFRAFSSLLALHSSSLQLSLTHCFGSVTAHWTCVAIVANRARSHPQQEVRDIEGWSYAIDFGAAEWHEHKKTHHFVRRRKVSFSVPTRVLRNSPFVLPALSVYYVML